MKIDLSNPSEAFLTVAVVLVLMAWSWWSGQADDANSSYFQEVPPVLIFGALCLIEMWLLCEIVAVGLQCA